jgi:flap endonuclease-1
MGIKGLLPFLKDRGCIQEFETWPEGVKIAVDVPIFAHKFIYSERAYEALEKKFLQFGNDLRLKKCEPIFVFDGERLEAKAKERLKRGVARDKQLDRNAIKQSKIIEDLLDTGIEIFAPAGSPPEFHGLMVPTKTEYASLKDFIVANGFDARSAKYEAEALCAHLVANGEAWAALTEDTDAVAFGAPRSIFRFFGTPILVDLNDTLQKLNFTYDQFVELCCLLGTDFCEHIYKIGPEASFKLMKKHSNWATIYEKERFGWFERTRTSGEAFNESIHEAKKVFMSRAHEIATAGVEDIVADEMS